MDIGTVALATVVGLIVVWAIAHNIQIVQHSRADVCRNERDHAAKMFKFNIERLHHLLHFRQTYTHMFRDRDWRESPWTYVRELRSSLYPDMDPLRISLHTWEIRSERSVRMGFKIWQAKHKTKTDPGSGSFSRVDRETALSGIKKYHWFTRDEVNVTHRVACLKHDATHSFVLLCDQEKRVEDGRVSQSEVGKGPALTCVTCVASDAP